MGQGREAPSEAREPLTHLLSLGAISGAHGRARPGRPPLRYLDVRGPTPYFATAKEQHARGHPSRSEPARRARGPQHPRATHGPSTYGRPLWTLDTEDLGRLSPPGRGGEAGGRQRQGPPTTPRRANVDLVHGNCARGLRRRGVPEPGHEAIAGGPSPSGGTSDSANGAGWPRRRWSPHIFARVCGSAPALHRARACRPRRSLRPSSTKSTPTPTRTSWWRADAWSSVYRLPPGGCSGEFKSADGMGDFQS